MTSSITIQAGQGALKHLRERGLSAQDIAVVPAAAGGPKGLILQALDQWLFGTWLPSAPRHRSFIGASIGSWRMAAACHADPHAAFQYLGDLYCEQRYPRKPSSKQVTDEVAGILHNFMQGRAEEVLSHPWHHLHIVTSRGRGALAAPHSALQNKLGFGKAALANGWRRQSLSNYMERVIFSDPRQALPWLVTPFDHFDTEFSALHADNLEAALLASGTLPLVMDAVTGIPHAGGGMYWDGGIVDYHLAYPYQRLNNSEANATNSKSELVLYPHFTDHIVPGWLDKAMKWRHVGRGKPNLDVDNVILVSPSPTFLQSIPRGKLPDRQDFFHYDLDHAARIKNWKIAMSEAQRLRDDLAAFVANPLAATILLLNA